MIDEVRGNLVTIPQSCPIGLTEDDLEKLFGDELEDFKKWMVGQTFSICTGERYDFDQNAYTSSSCFPNPHGYVYYRGDVERYILGLPVID